MDYINFRSLILDLEREKRIYGGEMVNVMMMSFVCMNYYYYVMYGGIFWKLLVVDGDWGCWIILEVVFVNYFEELCVGVNGFFF